MKNILKIYSQHLFPRYTSPTQILKDTHIIIAATTDITITLRPEDIIAKETPQGNK